MFLVACGTRTVYEEKKVPIYMVPEPPTISRPELPIHDLEISVTDFTSEAVASEKIGEISQAYVISVRLLLNWGQALEKIVETYRKMSKEDFSVDPVVFSTAAIRSAADAQAAIPGVFASGEASEDAESIEPNRSDFATLKVFANQQFNDIINKYEEDKRKIIEEADETKPNQDTQ